MQDIDRQLQLHETQRIDLEGVMHTFLTALNHQRGREGERGYRPGCSAKQTLEGVSTR